MSVLRPAVTVVIGFTFVLGIAVPAVFTQVVGAAMPRQAGGSLIERNGRVVGSELIGQNFTEARYFHPRPSATSAADPRDATKTVDAPYNAAASAASQRGPTSEALLAAVKERVAGEGPAPVPADAVTASGSGLDPDISPENAGRQVARVAQTRNLPPERVRDLVAASTAAPLFGLLGAPRVNVLRLNLALDEAR